MCRLRPINHRVFSGNVLTANVILPVAVLSALDQGLGSDGNLVQLLRKLTQIIDGTFYPLSSPV